MHLDNITCACDHGVVRIYCITLKCDVDKSHSSRTASALTGVGSEPSTLLKSVATRD